MTLSLFDDTPPPVSPLPVNTEPWKQYDGVTLYLGDNLVILRSMKANCIDAVVTDSPYGIGFMGKEWDTLTPEKIADNNRKTFQIGAGRLRDHENPNLRGRSHSPALSPSNIEYDRTLEGQRAFQAWCFEWACELFRVLKPGGHLLACGAPRSSHRMVSGIEDAGFEIRDSISWSFAQGFPKSHNLDGEWDGWGTALKPGHEPICVARKPFDATVEDNMQRWGVGALNIDRCRIEGVRDDDREPDLGRWPTNVALDEDAALLLDEQSGRAASRFFFCPKPSRAERDFGCDDLPMLTPGECTDRKDGSAGLTAYAGAGRSGGGRNPHPTVKPVHLMRWLIWLVTPPGGIVLDPFLGSGTTGMAAVVDEYRFIGIERELSYASVAAARIAASWNEAHAS